MFTALLGEHIGKAVGSILRNSNLASVLKTEQAKSSHDLISTSP